MGGKKSRIPASDIVNFIHREMLSFDVLSYVVSLL